MAQKANDQGREALAGDVLLAGERPGFSEFEGWPQVLAARYAISIPHAVVMLEHLRDGGRYD